MKTMKDSGYLGDMSVGVNSLRRGLGTGKSRIIRRLAGWAVASLPVLLLVACAHMPGKRGIALPPLRLAPAALGCEIALQQRLHIEFGEHVHDLDALLEVDANEVRLMVQGLGQVGVRLHWDGHELQQKRAAWLPPVIRAERVLDDLQFVLWGRHQSVARCHQAGP